MLTQIQGPLDDSLKALCGIILVHLQRETADTQLMQLGMFHCL